MQAEWELSKENFQPLKRGRKGVSRQEGSLCQKGDVDSQRRRAYTDELSMQQIWQLQS